MTQKPNTCFVISPIGEPSTDIRRQSDNVFKHIISKAIEPLGYQAIRADQISEPGIITTQVIEQIIDAPLVIADLSHHNPNVFYELAVRHAAHKPLIMIISRGEEIPFDVSTNRAIQYDLNDLDTVEKAKEEIAKQVKSLENVKRQPDNPISNTLLLADLKKSGDLEQRSIADIMERLDAIARQIALLPRPPNPFPEQSFNPPTDIPQLSVSPWPVSSGTHAIARGGGFSPNTLITIRVNNTIVATVTSGALGSFELQFTIPVLVSGRNTLTASDARGLSITRFINS